MPAQIVEATTNEYGAEEHPAWVLIGASRVSHSPPGVVLFDSDVRHQHYVIVRLQMAQRKRDLHRDWIGGAKGVPIVEVALSEAQWASFVSSMNTGDGVPGTLRWHEDTGDVPGMPYEPRLKESMDEVRAAAEAAQANVLEKFQAYKEHKTVGNLRSLEAAIENMPSNISFAAKSLSEHAENVVQRARADIEAFVVSKARQLGLEPGDVGETFQLTAGEPEAE